MFGFAIVKNQRRRSAASRRQASLISRSFAESNREGFGCEHYLISQAIDPGYKAYLMYNLLINI
jgi:hypothetical protein